MTKKKVWQIDHVSVESYPRVGLLTSYLLEKYGPETEILMEFDWDDEYDYSNATLAVRYERLETDLEYNRRLKQEAREKARQEKARAKQEAEELATLKRLKKKYPNA